MANFKLYYSLVKPGIVYGNALTAAAGFFLASAGSFQLPLFIAMIVGLSLIVASACVFNNYIDRDIDGKMERTKDRALALGHIPVSHALVCGLVLGVAGVLILLLYTNLLTLAVALFGFVVYVCVYSFAKRSTVYATHIGALAGAVPPIVGYTAIHNSLDTGAIVLFLILLLWQMPHFFSIAIYREGEYRAAQIPVRPIHTGILKTKMIIALYCAAFIFAVITPSLIGFTGYVYATVLFPLSLAWFVLAIAGFWATNDTGWARRMFLFSLVVIVVFSLMLILNGLVQLP
ncbi:MAG: heme o synthase [bacterium]|nr:heme o synthase [bacterium]